MKLFFSNRFSVFACADKGKQQNYIMEEGSIWGGDGKHGASKQGIKSQPGSANEISVTKVPSIHDFGIIECTQYACQGD